MSEATLFAMNRLLGIRGNSVIINGTRQPDEANGGRR
jgi:hypothetical protein